MKLCDNCLGDVEPEARPFPIGWDRGSQRDPFQLSLDLCLGCQATLGGRPNEEGLVLDLAAFHSRWAAGREVSRPPG